MPRGGGLATGAGIAQGVSAFTQSFLAARQQKNMMELNKNDRLAQLLLGQIQDENTTHYKRTALIDEYQKLYDKNPKMPLSQILGLHKIDDEDYQTGTKDIKKNPEIPTVHQNAPTDFVLPPEQQNLTQQEPVFKKYGDTTPAEVKLKLQRDLEDVRGKREVAHAKELYQAQADIMGKGGFTQRVGESYDPVTKDYRVVFQNPSTGETKENVLHNFNPLRLEEAGIKSFGTGSNKPSIFVRDQIEYWKRQTNPETNALFSEDEAKTKALGDAYKKFTSQQDLREAVTESQRQNITGTKPITPAQNIDDERAKDQIRLGLQTSYDNFNAQQIAADSDAASKEAEMNNHWNTVVEPIKDLMTTMEVDTPEYQTQQSRLNAATRDNQHLRNLYDIAKKQSTRFGEQAKAAQKRLEAHDNKKSISKATSVKSSNKTMSALDKKRIAQAKANPANAEIIKKFGMSDQAILDYINARLPKK